MKHNRLTVASALLTALSLGVAACTQSGAPNGSTVAPAPVTPVTTAGAMTAGAQVGTFPPAPAGWTPPASIAPVNPPPGMFQSTGTAPAQPGAKVRVFFLGMQW